MKKLCYGTWQFSPDFNKVTYEQARKLVLYARENGINIFDTALAYGKGNVEKVLGTTISNDDFVITKIPALRIVKPYEKVPMKYAYDENVVQKSVRDSICNLKREPNVVLLHNWSKYWEATEASEKIFECLNDMKRQGLFQSVGVSLPNSFGEQDLAYISQKCDYIEVPFNRKNQWLSNSASQLKEMDVKIVIRSIFETGKIFEEDIEESEVGKDEKIIYDALKYADLITIGMTSKEKIDKNIHIFEKFYN